MKTKIIITALALVLVATPVAFATTKKITDDKQHATDVEKSKEACVLKANNKYSDTIREQGIVMTINGEKMTGLSSEEWKSIDDQRKIDTSKCDGIV